MRWFLVPEVQSCERDLRSERSLALVRIEEQAIARTHRMGQVRRVDVHRLLAEDSINQRILETIERRTIEFELRRPRMEEEDKS
jgi:hypothetical protein